MKPIEILIKALEKGEGTRLNTFGMNMTDSQPTKILLLNRAHNAKICCLDDDGYLIIGVFDK